MQVGHRSLLLLFKSLKLLVNSDGVGRTGTFICIHAQLERLKNEGVVDFFQFVKSARTQRPGVILNVVGLLSYLLCNGV